MCKYITKKGVKRVLGIDYGSRRIGVALSDINWTIASPYLVLDSKNIFAKLLPILSDQQVGLAVIGLPVALNGGKDGLQLRKVKMFVNKLKEKTDIEIVLWDERMSTLGAQNSILEYNLSKAKAKQIIDKISASFILAGFLEYCKNQ
jgi:putative Holliday junction resolvase